MSIRKVQNTIDLTDPWHIYSIIHITQDASDTENSHSDIDACNLLQRTSPNLSKLWTSDEQLSSTNGQKGFRQVYFDEVNQREASFSNTSQYGLVISDYKANNGDGKVYYINIYGGKRHCMLWCEPDTPVICDAADSLCQPPRRVPRKMGAAVINGIDTTVYKWGDNLGPIPMNELYLYVNEETKGPVRMGFVMYIHLEKRLVTLLSTSKTSSRCSQSQLQYGTWEVTKETVIVQSPVPTVGLANF